MQSEQIEVTLTVISVLEDMGVRYAVGGSFASAVHGVMRATMDADLIVDLREQHVQPMIQLLGDSFYADENMIRDAIGRHKCFNLIHLETAFKVDLFVVKPRRFDQLQLDRRQLQLLAENPARHVYVATAEDTVLSKLEWYRLGNEISERQWRDVLGVLRVQAGHLDTDYLVRMAEELGVSDLLERAIRESGQQ